MTLNRRYFDSYGDGTFILQWKGVTYCLRSMKIMSDARAGSYKTTGFSKRQCESYSY